MKDSLIIIFGLSLLPLLMLAAAVGFTRRYRRATARSMGINLTLRSSAAKAPAAFAHDSLLRRLQDINPLAGEASDALDEARRATARSRFAFVASSLPLIFFTTAAIFLASRGQPEDAQFWMAYLMQLPALFVLLTFVAASSLQWLLTALLYLSIGIVLVPFVGGWARAPVLIALVSELSALYLLVALILLASRKLRPLLVGLVAILLYVVAAAIIAAITGGYEAVLQESHAITPGLIAVSLVNPIMAVVILGWLLKRPAMRVAGLIVLASLVAMGLVLEWLFDPPYWLQGPLVGLPMNVLQVLFVWFVFKVFVVLEDRHFLANSVLHAHLCWALYAAYFVIILTHGYPANGWWLGWMPIVGFLAYALLLHALLFRNRLMSARPAKRMLLLRVFGDTSKRERLLDALEDTWLRVGRIDLIAGTDLALRSLRPRMLEAFLLNRVDAQFLKMDEEVDKRLARLRTDREGDGRYPVNEIHCAGDAWQYAVTRVAVEADIVVMDFRGFTLANQGCVFELTRIVQLVSLNRVLVLADKTTDFEALESVTKESMMSLPSSSPNYGVGNTELLVHEAVGKERSDALAVVRLIFNRAF